VGLAAPFATGLNDMGRPREHDVESLLERATAIMAERGVHGLTLRGLAEETGASNGTIHHAFRSRANLVAMAYLREAERFLALQLDAVQQARSTAPSDSAAPVVAAAQAVSAFAEESPTGATFLLLVRYDELLKEDVRNDLRDRLVALTKRLGALFIELAKAGLGRHDRVAVDTIRACVVDVPTGLLMHRNQLTDPYAVLRVEAAVRGILAAIPATQERGRP